MASEIGYDDGVWSLPDGVLNPLGPIEVGGATYRLVGGNGYASLQEAIDAASDGEILLVAPGSYTEGRQFTADEIGLPGYGQNHYGLLINKSVTIQGVSANGAPIGDVADVAATIVARYQAGYETSFAVTAQDVTIRGLGFVPTNEKSNPAQATDRINKAFEIYGDGFTLEHSTIEQQGELPTSSAIFFNGEGSTENVNTATVAGNVIYGSITLVNGAGGDGDPATSIVIADNVIVGDLLPAIRLNGDIAGVQWLQADVGLPVLTGNTIQFGVEGVSLVVYSGNLAQEGDSVTLEELDAYVAAVMAANDGIGAAVKDASGHVQITPLSNLTSVGDSGLGVAIYGSLQDAIDAAEEGDVIELAGGTYVEDVIVAKSGLTVRAAEGAEVTLQGGFFVNGSGAEGFTFALEGLTIERGLETTDFGNTARFKGLYIKGDADVTVDGVELVAGTGYSGVMADQYRGIEVEAGSAASVTVLDSEFVNWKTGIYLNAGASLSVEGSAFSGNVAGIGTDGPAALSVTNSTFADQTSEAIGFTPGKTVGSLTLSGLEVTGSPVANVALGDAQFEGGGLHYVTNVAQLQAALGAAANGDTIVLGAGTYDLSAALSIGKSLTFLGANVGTPGGDDARAAETILTWSSAQAISVTANVDVRFDGMKFIGGKVLHGGGGASGTIEFTNSTFELGSEWGKNNFYLETPGHLVFTDNHVTVEGDTGAFFQFVGRFAGDVEDAKNRVTIERNTFVGTGEDGRPVIANLSSMHGVVADNVFDGVDIGVLIADGTGDLAITGNTFENISRGESAVASGSYGAGIAFYAPHFKGPIAISGNTFENVDAAIRTSGAGDLTELTIEIDGNTFADVIHVLYNAAMTGTLTALDSTVDGAEGVTAILGSSGDDTLTGTAGADVIAAGGGTDTLVLGGARADYAVQFDLASQRFTLVDLRDGAPDGHDVVYGVELFQFTDGVLTATELRGSQTLTVGAGDGYQFASIQAAIDAALAGDTIEIAAGTYAEALTLNGKALSLTAADGAVVIDPPGTGLTALTLEGAFGADAVVSVAGLTFTGGAVGIRVHDGAVLGELRVDGVTFAELRDYGVMVGDGTYGSGPAAALGLLTVHDSLFENNGAGQSQNQGAALKLWRYAGALDLENTAIVGAEAPDDPRPANALEIQGSDNQHLGEVWPLGNVRITGLDIDGYFSKNPLAIFNYSNVAGLAIPAAGDDPGIDFTDAVSGWGPLLNLDGIASSYDASLWSLELPASGPVTELQGDKAEEGATSQTIVGTAYADRLIGKGGNDTLYGGDGDDELYGSDKPGGALEAELGSDRLYGGAGDDLLVGGGGNDLLEGGEGHDALHGGAGNDRLYGGADDDLLDGGAGNDTLDGGAGFDTAQFAGNLGDYEITLLGSAVQVSSAAEGVDTLTNVELLEFADAQIDLTAPVRLFDASGHLKGTYDAAALQDALDAALDGDRIVLAAGTYSGNFAIDKTLTLIGPKAGLAGFSALRGDESSEASIVGTVTVAAGAVIDGVRIAGALTVAAEGETAVEGFTLRNSVVEAGDFPIAITIEAAVSTTLAANRIVGGEGAAIDVPAGFDGLAILGNWIEAAAGADGIVLKAAGDSDNAVLISGNTLTGGSHGVLIDADGQPLAPTDSITIDGNSFGEVQNGVVTGAPAVAGVYANGAVPAELDASLGVSVGLNNYHVGAGGVGVNVTFGSDGADLLVDAATGNELSGGAGNDILRGRGGDDVLDGGEGDDILYGGGGADTARYQTPGGGTLTPVLGEGDAIVAYRYDLAGDAGHFLVSRNLVEGYFEVKEYAADHETLVSTDRLFGMELVQFTNGDAPETVDLSLLGSIQIRVTDPSKVADAFEALLPGDSVEIDADFGGAAIAVPLSGATVTVGESAKNLTLKLDADSDVRAITIGGSGDVALVGNDLGVTLDGSNSTGNLSMTGGAGNDVLRGGSGSNTFTLATGGGTDIVDAGTSGDSTVRLTSANAGVVLTLGGGTVDDDAAAYWEEALGDGALDEYRGRQYGAVYYSTAADGNSAALLFGITSAVGSVHGDVLVGDGADNVFEGHGGDDLIVGGGGTDVAVFAGPAADYTIARIDTAVLSLDEELAAAFAGPPELGYAGLDAAFPILRVVYIGADQNLATDTVVQVETLRFGDTEVEYTFAQDAAGLWYLQLADGGVSYSAGDSSDGNYVVGGSGDDTLVGGDGNDVLHGGEGHDLLDGGSGSDRLVGGLGDDVLRGGPGGDVLLGGDGADVLYGGAGEADTDYLVGGAGEDYVLLDGARADYRMSRASFDLDVDGDGENEALGGFKFEHKDTGAVVYVDEDTELVAFLGTAAAEDFAADDDDTYEELLDLASFLGPVAVYHDGMLVAGAETLAEAIALAQPGDRIEIEAGTDLSMEGVVDVGKDGLTIYGDATVTLQGLELGEDVVSLYLEGTFATTVHGNGHDNFIRGNDGGTVLMGGDGDDVLIGGAGNDTLVGGGGADLLVTLGGDDVLLAGAGDDRIVLATRADAAGRSLVQLGSGADELIVGWAGGTAVEIDAAVTDFRPGQDSINFGDLARELGGALELGDLALEPSRSARIDLTDIGVVAGGDVAAPLSGELVLDFVNGARLTGGDFAFADDAAWRAALQLEA